MGGPPLRLRRLTEPGLTNYPKCSYPPVRHSPTTRQIDPRPSSGKFSKVLRWEHRSDAPSNTMPYVFPGDRPTAEAKLVGMTVFASNPEDAIGIHILYFGAVWARGFKLDGRHILGSFCEDFDANSAAAEPC